MNEFSNVTSPFERDMDEMIENTEWYANDPSDILGVENVKIIRVVFVDKRVLDFFVDEETNVMNAVVAITVQGGWYLNEVESIGNVMNEYALYRAQFKGGDTTLFHVQRGVSPLDVLHLHCECIEQDYLELEDVYKVRMLS